MKDNRIIIASLDDVITIISTRKTENICSIRDPEEAEDIDQIFELFKSNYNSLFQVCCHDINANSPGLKLIQAEEVRDVIKWSRNKSEIIFHCRSGVARSSAFALIYACTRMPVEQAVKLVIDPTIHWPNSAILALGEQELGLEGKIIPECKNHIIRGLR